MIIKWEEIKHDHDGYLYRCRIPGGWIVKLSESHTVVGSGYGGEWTEYQSSMLYVPDANHEWGLPQDGRVTESE